MATARAPWRDPAQALGDATVWASSGRRTGGWEADLPASHGGTVWVSTQCEGWGTLTVDAGRYGTSTEHCSEQPDGSLNAFEGMGTRTAGQVKVTAGPGVTWAVAVGWNPGKMPASDADDAAMTTPEN
ncbi:hypothetical protein ACIP98_16755 [Streptomyces sp. NPDC088354]|uniref:hypothetical protein n=1 Tax=Streptomyces sp. NPDC088354 TaxID=3365856 RepID=UPI00381C5FF2